MRIISVAVIALIVLVVEPEGVNSVAAEDVAFQKDTDATKEELKATKVREHVQLFVSPILLLSCTAHG